MGSCTSFSRVAYRVTIVMRMVMYPACLTRRSPLGARKGLENRRRFSHISAVAASQSRGAGLPGTGVPGTGVAGNGVPGAMSMPSSWARTLP